MGGLLIAKVPAARTVLRASVRLTPVLRSTGPAKLSRSIAKGSLVYRAIEEHGTAHIDKAPP